MQHAYKDLSCFTQSWTIKKHNFKKMKVAQKRILRWMNDYTKGQIKNKICGVSQMKERQNIKMRYPFKMDCHIQRRSYI